MNKRVDFSLLEGISFTQDLLDFMQTSYRNGLGTAIASLVGDLVIISGVADLGANWGDGWVCINGEILPFVGGVKAPRIIVEETVEQEEYGDGSSKDAYFTKQAKLASAGGNLFTDFVRLPTIKDMSLKKTKIINIGTWNMDTTPTKSIAHGITDLHTKKHWIDITIIADDDAGLVAGQTSSLMESGNWLIPVAEDPTVVILTRNNAGNYDSSNYDKTSGAYNRGWVKIEYFD